MQKHLKFLGCVALSVVLGTSTLAQDAVTGPDTVVATVNGVDITIGHMIVARATLPQQYQQLEDKVLFDGILEQLVQQQALASSFTGELPPRATLSLDNELRSLKAGEVLEMAMAEPISDAELEAAFSARYADSVPESEYNASHILVETEDEAKVLVAELEGGADFAELAREKSTGPSGPNGGELGWFGPGMMVPSFEAATIALEVGTISGPVETQFGWHVIRLNETRQKALPTLDDLREELTDTLRQENARARIDAATSEAEVILSKNDAIDPAILKNIDILE